MKLPNAHEAIVSEQKVEAYLLSFDHPRGRYKAAFFAAFGYEAGRPGLLVSALKQHAALHEVAKVEETSFGIRYTVDGELESPDTRRPRVRAVWFVEHGETAPRLVTAYPVERRRP